VPRSSHPAVSAFPGRGRRVGLHIDLFEACSAFTRGAACTLARSPIRDPLIEGFSHFVTSMTAPIASGWSESPGGPCTHWKAPPFHGARRKQSFAHLSTLSELYFRRAATAAPRLLVLWSFAVEQNALAFDAPSIAGERTVAANDTMAGNGDGKTVRSASSCHGADRRRCANALRNLRIGDRCADWDLLEHLPHASLESR